MVRVVKVGAGITARTVRRLDHRNPEDAAEIAADEAAVAELEAAGIDGFFGLTTLHVRAFLAGEIERAGPPPWPEESRADFARRILDRIELADRVIKGGAAGLAAQFAFEAGDLWRAAVMKWQWEPDALRGQKVLYGARESARDRKEENEPLRRARLERMTALINTGMTTTEAARECEAEGLGDWRAIIRQVNRAKAKAR